MKPFINAALVLIAAISFAACATTQPSPRAVKAKHLKASGNGFDEYTFGTKRDLVTEAYKRGRQQRHSIAFD